MVSGFRVFDPKSAAESFERVVVSLSEKVEGFCQFSGFLLHFIHEALGKYSVFLFHFVHGGLPHKHHYRVGLNSLGRVIYQVVTSLWKPDDHGKLRTMGRPKKIKTVMWAGEKRQLKAAKDAIVNEFRFKH
jgi:hypothetical protein